MISLLEQIQLVKLASRQDEKLEKTAPANTISLLEQIQHVKMASRWNEDWAEDMFGLPAEQQWQLEIFLLLIWPREICMRSIYPNMLPLQWNFLPGSAIVSKFPTFLGIGNPTDIHGSWGTWLFTALWGGGGVGGWRSNEGGLPTELRPMNILHEIVKLSKL